METLTPIGDAVTFDKLCPIDCVADNETLQGNSDSASARGLPVCTVQPLRKGKLAIVASGPSVGDYVEMLKSWDGEIWGINGAFAWMIHRGIEPHAFVGVDPELMLKDYLPEPLENATYYLASQVHPGVFDYLSNRDVRLWYSSARDLKYPIGTVLVPGGSTCLARSPYLACMLGWQNVHLFGGDSSYTHKTHVYGGLPPSNFCFAEAGGHIFKTHKVMISQACDIVELVQNFPGTITVHGHGFMQCMVDDLKKSGMHELLIAEETLALGGHLNRAQRRALKRRAA